jgi:hypothetical protein
MVIFNSYVSLPEGMGFQHVSTILLVVQHFATIHSIKPGSRIPGPQALAGLCSL